MQKNCLQSLKIEKNPIGTFFLIIVKSYALHVKCIRHKYSLGQFVAKSYALYVKLHLPLNLIFKRQWYENFQTMFLSVWHENTQIHKYTVHKEQWREWEISSRRKAFSWPSLLWPSCQYRFSLRCKRFSYLQHGVSVIFWNTRRIPFLSVHPGPLNAIFLQSTLYKVSKNCLVDNV